jgi:para-aminobenzoate synthetase/4-amino-4-deoxychorismate lyase
MSINEAVLFDSTTQRWLHFKSPQVIIETECVDEVMEKLNKVEQAVEEDGLYAAGFVSYEASPAFDSSLTVKSDSLFPKLWFGLYNRPKEIDIYALKKRLPPIVWTPSVSPEQYSKNIKKIKQYIQEGDTYQVNHTFRLRGRCSSEPWDIFLELINAQKCSYGGFLNIGDWVVCSASPELFFQMDHNLVESRPMKGTAARGLTYEDDIEQKGQLAVSEKNQAENVMIVDMVRNDLGHIAEPGTVFTKDLFAIEKYPTVWQMTSTVQAKTNATVTDIFKALFPPASITGAPKSRTMEIIAELESSPRRIYTGTLGFMKPRRRAQFNVSIRTMLINRRENQAEYGVGGGIVWDSTASSEMMECYAKARILDRSPPPDFSLIETIRWTPEHGYWLLELHLARLARSAKYFDFKVNIQEIRSFLMRRKQDFSSEMQKVRLLIAENGSYTCQVELVQESEMSFPDKIMLARSPVHKDDPFLYHKTTHRAVYQEKLAECPGFKEVVLFNENNEVTEATIANVVVELDGIYYTPPVCCGLLAGVYREELLAKGKIHERVLTVDQVLHSSKVFLLNSVRGMSRVEVVSN